MPDERIHGRDSSASVKRGPEPQPVDLTGGRFVVLHHTGVGEPHFDLMFEQARSLATWRSPCPLREIADQPVPVTHIGDHRLAYLDYEGALSGGRGRVERIERGTFMGKQIENDDWHLVITGDLTVGEIRFARDGAGEGWFTQRGA